MMQLVYVCEQWSVYRARAANRAGEGLQCSLQVVVCAGLREHMAAEVAGREMYWVVPRRRACARVYVETGPPALSCGRTRDGGGVSRTV